jgi:cysteine synthase B
LSAYNILRKTHAQGLKISPSSAANIQGAIDLANQLEAGVIVTVLPDDASKYSEALTQILH